MHIIVVCLEYSTYVLYINHSRPRSLRPRLPGPRPIRLAWFTSRPRSLGEGYFKMLSIGKRAMPLRRWTRTCLSSDILSEITTALYPTTSMYFNHKARRCSRMDCCSTFIIWYSSHSTSRPTKSVRYMDMRQFKTIETLIEAVCINMDALSPRNKSSFWAELSKLLRNKGIPSRTNDIVKKQLDSILVNTLENVKLKRFDDRDVATIVISLVKIVRQGGYVSQKTLQMTLDDIASLILPMLPRFQPRYLSNLIYAYSLADCVPKIKGGRNFYDILAFQAISKLHLFNSQDFSNMLWAYANVCVSNSDLFMTVGDAIVALDDLSDFNSQHISNIIWSYATAGESHHQLYKALADHIIKLDNLSGYKAQNCSNIVWAYATACQSNPRLFQKIANHIIDVDDLHSFKPQEISNTVWSFASANENHPGLFKKVADHVVALGNLSGYSGQTISNIALSYATAGEAHAQLFSKLADHIIALEDLSGLSEQAISNIIWAFTNTGESHPQLFGVLADHVIASDLRKYKPQALSIILWAYAGAGESHPMLFKKIADHISCLEDLSGFKSQALSNILWAIATAGESHPRLFNRLADRIISDDLSEFIPQHFANILWSYATVGETHPRLFKKCADCIVEMDLTRFMPQNFSNIAWAFATAGELHPLLFQKLADVSIARSNEFSSNSQAVANLLWAYATIGQNDHQLFSSFAPVVTSIISECSSQGITNIAWAYAVSNVDVSSLFNDGFIRLCLDRESSHTNSGLAQLHQWHLWREEIKSSIELPPRLREKCYHAFTSSTPEPSRFQDEVISELTSIGLSPEEEVLTKSGYRLDAIVEIHGKKIGIEVDGPSHFIGRKPTGNTILKHRQVHTLDTIPLLSVSYWDWNEVRKDRDMKHQYLRSALGRLCA